MSHVAFPQISDLIFLAVHSHTAGRQRCCYFGSGFAWIRFDGRPAQDFLSGSNIWLVGQPNQKSFRRERKIFIERRKKRPSQHGCSLASQLHGSKGLDSEDCKHARYVPLKQERRGNESLLAVTQAVVSNSLLPSFCRTLTAHERLEDKLLSSRFSVQRSTRGLLRLRERARSDFRDAIAVDECANRLEQIVAFRLELGSLVIDRAPMPSDLPERQCRVLDREGGAVFGQVLKVIARPSTPVLPGIVAAANAFFEDVPEVGRALILVEERCEKEMSANRVVTDLEQAGFSRIGSRVVC